MNDAMPTESRRLLAALLDVYPEHVLRRAGDRSVPGLGEAIEEVDQAAGGAPAYYMINCAHPDHFDATLASGGAWIDRIGGLRANASRLSHAELDVATELDAARTEPDPERLADLFIQMNDILVNDNVMLPLVVVGVVAWTIASSVVPHPSPIASPGCTVRLR